MSKPTPSASRLRKVTIANSQRAVVVHEDLYDHRVEKRENRVTQALPRSVHEVLNRLKLHYLLSTDEITSSRRDKLDALLAEAGGEDKLGVDDRKKLTTLRVSQVLVSYDQEDKVTPNRITIKCNKRALKTRDTGHRPAPPIYRDDKEYSRPGELFGLLSLLEGRLEGYVVRGETLSDQPPLTFVDAVVEKGEGEGPEEGEKAAKGKTVAHPAAKKGPAKGKGKASRKRVASKTGAVAPPN